MSNSLIATKLQLNNWHYIKEKTLSFHEEINFFTGHSGSGKSTVIDALQVLLYADTDGRGFFNKAAKDDSNRTLMEYLRGMNNVGENGASSYLRNKNFSSTIALEFLNSESKESQTIGVAFDVDVTANNIERMFFWHKGGLLENSYRYEGKTMTLNQLKEFLSRSRSNEDWWISRTNDKFRSKLYETYLGGLDERKFPMLFKKAISFRMDTKLEDFVKEFICVEKDIHIEDMQESVVQYVRLKRKLEDTKNEIEKLEKIQGQYKRYKETRNKIDQTEYNLKQLELDLLTEGLQLNAQRQQNTGLDLQEIEKQILHFEGKVKEVQAKQVEVKTAIQNSGYEHLQSELANKEELVARFRKSEQMFDTVLNSIERWETSKEYVSSLQNLIFDRSVFESKERFDFVKEQLSNGRTYIEEERTVLSNDLAKLNDEKHELISSITQLRNGQKAYPAYLIEAKEAIAAGLETIHGKVIPVDILADLIDVKEETWLNAIEGFMSNHKLKLIVAPEYVQDAMAIYETLDPKRYFKVAVIDTEKVMEHGKPVKTNALSEEIQTDLPYVKAYIDFLMGGIIKCNSLEELRTQKSGITPECVLYHGYSIQHIDPKHYQQFAYIGQTSIARRLQRLEGELQHLLSVISPKEELLNKYKEFVSLESLEQEYDYYKDLLQDTARIPELQGEISKVTQRIEELKARDLTKWKEEEERLEEEANIRSSALSEVKAKRLNKNGELERFKREYLDLSERYHGLKSNFVFDATRNMNYKNMLETENSYRLDRVKLKLERVKEQELKELEKEYEQLVLVRDEYRQKYAYRGFSTTAKDNDSYEQLLVKLESDQLQEFTLRAAEQAKKATSHFKTDFVYKIRDAIKEAMEQKDDLNQILKKTDFGKEKYRFVIEKNKGEDGKFYTMFMDDNLEINPNRLSNHMDNQMDLFSTSHEEEYSELINELLDIFMPPDDSDPLALEEARRNIEKYADYRTYLSFDMEQIIEGMPPMRLSKMLTKNSGGEGQNPLYVALLASFAQVYRINLRKNMRRRLTPRLVILDEAFSKMDGEKVASCVELIRKLGFQAIISATNDKIQNYVESVDKTFVFANPNKSYISIQPFEKREFQTLINNEEKEHMF